MELDPRLKDVSKLCMLLRVTVWLQPEGQLIAKGQRLESAPHVVVHVVTVGLA